MNIFPKTINIDQWTRPLLSLWIEPDSKCKSVTEWISTHLKQKGKWGKLTPVSQKRQVFMVHFSCGCSFSWYTFPVNAILHGARVYFFQGCTFLLLQKLPRRQAWQGVNWPSEKKTEQKRTREIAWKCIFQLSVQSKLSKHENIELKEVPCLIAWGLFQAYKISKGTKANIRTSTW